MVQYSELWLLMFYQLEIVIPLVTVATAHSNKYEGVNLNMIQCNAEMPCKSHLFSHVHYVLQEVMYTKYRTVQYRETSN